MATPKYIGGPDMEVVYDDGPHDWGVLNTLEPGSPAVKAKLDAAQEKKTRESAAPYKDIPGAGALTRLGEGAKIDPVGKAEFVAWVIGKGDTKEERIADGMNRVFPLEGGGVAYIDASGKKRMVNQPVTKGQLALLAAPLAGPLAPVAIAAIERKFPGTLRETAGDIAGNAADAGEGLIGGVVEAFGRGRGGVGRQVAAGAAGDTLAAFARRGVSAMIPGRDIGPEETAKRAAINAGVGVVARGATGAVAEMVPLTARPTYPERLVGRKVIGTAEDAATVQRGLDIEDTMKANFDPAALSLNADAQIMSGNLASSPGTAEAWMRHDVNDMVAPVSDYLRKSVDAKLGAGLPAEQVGKTTYGLVVKAEKRLDDFRKMKFAEDLDVAVKASGNAKIPVPNYRPASAGAPSIPGMHGAPATTGEVAVPTMGIAEIQDELARLGRKSYGGGVRGAERTPDMAMAQKDKELLLKDLEDYAGPGADELHLARKNYAINSRPLDDFDTVILAGIMNKGKKLAYADIPKVILKGQGEQIDVAMRVLRQRNPNFAKKVERSVFDEAIFGPAAAEGNSMLGKRLTEKTRATGVDYLNPAKAAAGIEDNLDTLMRVHGPDKAFEADLLQVKDAFQRMSITQAARSGSQTSRASQWAQVLKAIGEIPFNPKEGLAEVGSLVYRRRLTNMLLDKNLRNELIGIGTMGPNVAGRSGATTAQRIAALVFRADTADTEEGSNP